MMGSTENFSPIKTNLKRKKLKKEINYNQLKVDYVSPDSGISDVERCQQGTVSVTEAASDDDVEVKTSVQSGWADAMNKVLRVNPKSEDFILSKALKDRDLEKKLKQASPDSQPESLIPEGSKSKSEEKKNISYVGRKTPCDYDVPQEKKFRKIAAQGVIKLFNAVREHQGKINKELKKVGSSEWKQESVYKSVNKGKFIDMLKGKPNSGLKGNDIKVEQEVDMKDESNLSDDSNGDCSDIEIKSEPEIEYENEYG